MVGGLVMGVLNNGMSLKGISVDWQMTIKGIVLLLAVAFDVWNKRRSTVSNAATTVPVEDGSASGMPDQDQADDLVATE